MNSIIEISKKNSKAGRTPITMILHKIHKNDDECNKNGITWVRKYCENNIESIKGMQLVAQFLDEKHEVPFGDHGNMIVEENKVIFEDSLVVGSFEKGFISEDIEINGEIINAVVGKGYIYDQRFPALVEFLQQEKQNNNPIEGSVEICAASGNKKIIYDGGWKEKFRKPQIFDYSGHALVIGTTPADDSALLLELNSYKKKEGETNIMNIEINAMNYNDISIIVENEFNKKFNQDKTSWSYFYVHKFYPTISTFIMKSWDKIGEYYQTTYTVENGVLSIGDIIKVEESWEPVNGEQPIEVNTPVKNIINKYKEVKNMDEKIVMELNQKIEDKINEINSLNKSLEEKSNVLSEKEVEVNALTQKVKELDEKVIELNTTIVEVNKLLESEKTEKETLVAEVNSFREEKAKIETETKIAEVNAYFENEISKNGFEEAEVNSLKTFVEAIDLEGLRKAEAELCAKKFKEMISKDQDTEINTQNNLFIRINEKEKKEVKGSIPSFFN